MITTRTRNIIDNKIHQTYPAKDQKHNKGTSYTTRETGQKKKWTNMHFTCPVTP